MNNPAHSKCGPERQLPGNTPEEDDVFAGMLPALVPSSDDEDDMPALVFSTSEDGDYNDDDRHTSDSDSDSDTHATHPSMPALTCSDNDSHDDDRDELSADGSGLHVEAPSHSDAEEAANFVEAQSLLSDAGCDVEPEGGSRLTMPQRHEDAPYFKMPVEECDLPSGVQLDAPTAASIHSLQMMRRL